MKILYEDNHLLAVGKPSGLLTQPSGTDEESLEEQAKQYLKEAHNKPGNVFLEAVHRLDRPVSGIVLFAKTSKALSRMNAAMRARQCTKLYVAEVEGLISTDTGTLKHSLHHGDHKSYVDENGKEAILHYEVIKRTDKTTHVEIVLETGRYHQIRVQFSHIGHPILGDVKYDAGHALPNGAIALSHKTFEFPHPITKELIKLHFLQAQ